MECKGKTDIALRPYALNSGVIGGDFSFEDCAYGGNAELETGAVLRESGDFDAVDTLIEAVHGGFERALFSLGNVRGQMWNVVTGREGAGTVAFDRGRGVGRRWLVTRWRLGAGRNAISVAERQKGERRNETHGNGLQTKPPYRRIP